MKSKYSSDASIQAEKWAYEFHTKVMCELPPQIRRHIDWDSVAADVLRGSLEDIPGTVRDSIITITEEYDRFEPESMKRDYHFYIHEHIEFLREWLIATEK